MNVLMVWFSADATPPAWVVSALDLADVEGNQEHLARYPTIEEALAAARILGRERGLPVHCVP